MWVRQGIWDAAAHKTPCFLTWFSSAWVLSQEVYPKRSCLYTILHVVLTQKAVTFALTVVSTKNLKKQYIRPSTYEGWTCQSGSMFETARAKTRTWTLLEVKSQNSESPQGPTHYFQVFNIILPPNGEKLSFQRCRWHSVFPIRIYAIKIPFP